MPRLLTALGAALMATLALAPAAHASKAGIIGSPQVLAVVDGAGEENAVQITFLTGPDRFRVTDAAGVQPGAPGCAQVNDQTLDCITVGVTGILVQAGAGNDDVDVDGSADGLVPGRFPAVIEGGGGNDNLRGGVGADRLSGAEGMDIVGGRSGADLIDGGSGNDGLLGLRGNDRIFGLAGADAILGGGGNDTILAGADDDGVIAGGGADRIQAGAGDDAVVGGKGPDRIFGGAGNDKLGAKDGARDRRISCGPGGRQRAVVDKGIDPKPVGC